MISSRAAQRTLAQGKRQRIFRISNRKIMLHGENHPPWFYVKTTKLSRSQSRAKRRVREYRLNMHYEQFIRLGYDDKEAWFWANDALESQLDKPTDSTT